MICESPTNHAIFCENRVQISFSYIIYKDFITREQQAFHTNLWNAQHSEQPFFTKLEAMRMLRVLFVAQLCV